MTSISLSHTNPIFKFRFSEGNFSYPLQSQMKRNRLFDSLYFVFGYWFYDWVSCLGELEFCFIGPEPVQDVLPVVACVLSHVFLPLVSGIGFFSKQKDGGPSSLVLAPSPVMRTRGPFWLSERVDASFLHL